MIRYIKTFQAIQQIYKVKPDTHGTFFSRNYIFTEENIFICIYIPNTQEM